jgi:Holliday junction resolvase
MNAKSKGSRNEHRSIRLLESLGYSCTRAAASLGAWDVIGICAHDTVLVQVKSNRWPEEVEMKDLRAFRCPANCKKLVHRWRDRQRIPDAEEVK